MNNCKHIAFGILASATLILASCGGGKANYNVTLKTDTDSASYIIGYFTGSQLANSGIEDFNIEAMGKGIQEMLKSKEKPDEKKMQEMQMFLQKYFTNLQTKVNEKNLKEGQAFLEENKKKQGIVTLPSGVQYKIIKEGTGAKPTKEEEVELTYKGTMIDGTEFDNSAKHGETVTLAVGQVVPGFSEALTLMTEGSIWEVYIPSELGYGENVRPGGTLKPNSVLIFEINMIKVKKPEAAGEMK